MATTSLRPLGVGEILDAGIKVVTRHWRPLLRCAIFFVLPLAVVSTVLTALIDPDQLELVGESAAPSATATDVSGEVWATRSIAIAFAMLTFLAVYLTCARAVTDAWRGDEPDVGASVRFGLRRAPAALVLGVVWAVAMTVAFALFLVPGIWLGVAWSLCVPVLLFEGAGPVRALTRSFTLLRERWWATLVLIVVCSLLVAIIGSVLQVVPMALVEGLAPESVVANALGTIVGTTFGGAISYPYYAAVLTILYFDQRARREGVDVDEALTGDAPPPHRPLEGEAERTDEALWSSPGGWAAPSPQRGESAAGSEPADGEAVEEDSGRGRAAWLPPEAPRGPGGL